MQIEPSTRRENGARMTPPNLDFKSHAYHALLVGFDEIGAGVFAFFRDAGVPRLPRLGTGAARLALGLGFRGFRSGGGRGGGDVDLGSFRGHIYDGVGVLLTLERVSENIFHERLKDVN